MARIQASSMDAVRSSAKPGSMVTIREVAKESGFSSTTVSIVLHNSPLARYIPDATKIRNRRAAHKLGYRPNVFARTLRNQRTRTVGVMVFDMTDPYCTPILRGIECALLPSFVLANPHRRTQRALPLRVLSGNAARSPGGSADRGCELGVREYRRVGRFGEEQYSYCNDRPRAAGRFGQFRHRGQRTGCPSRHRTFVLIVASQDSV